MRAVIHTLPKQWPAAEHDVTEHMYTEQNMMADLDKLLNAVLPSLVLQLKLLFDPALLRHFQPASPETMLGIQAMKLHCSCPFGLITLLLSSCLLRLSALMRCMLSHGMPGLHDAMLPEEHVEGGGNVLQMSLSCLQLSLLHSLACGYNMAPSLHHYRK